MRQMNKSKYLTYIIFVSVLLCDQTTKLCARRFLSDGSTFRVIGDFFGFQLSFNTGAAFGMLSGNVPLLILIGVCAIFIIVRAQREVKGSPLANIAFSLILSGAVGNTLDRIIFPDLGVTDFIRFDFGSYVFPNFNIADSALVCGTILLVCTIMLVEKRRGADS